MEASSLMNACYVCSPIPWYSQASKVPNVIQLIPTWQGLSASVTVSNGDVYSGIFFGASMEKEECKYLLKMVQQTRHGNKTEMNGVRETMSEYIGVGDDHAMSFNARDVVDLAVEGATIATQEKRSNGKLHLPAGKRPLTSCPRCDDWISDRWRYFRQQDRTRTGASAVGTSSRCRP